MLSLFVWALVISFPLFLISRGRKSKAKYYNNLSTDEKILYNLEQMNEKTASPLEELFWSVLGLVVGLFAPFILLLWFLS